MNYKNFHIEEDTLKVFDPNGRPVNLWERRSTINECIELVDGIIKLSSRGNYNKIDLLEFCEVENGKEESDRFKDWGERESENDINESINHFYE